MMKNRRFSLVELIILIVVVAILLILVIPMMFKTGTTAKSASCTHNLKQCIRALAAYGGANGNWICTYGNDYSPWYAQPGVPGELGFKLSRPGRSPLTGRPVTLCPDFLQNSAAYNTAQGYGAAWFILFPDDYRQEQSEHVVQLPANQGQFIQAGNIRRAANYVLLADSAFTAGFSGEGMLPGLQSVLFTRRKEGMGEALDRAIILRHNGEANIGYLDGHIGDTADRVGMLVKSKIGAYVDAIGRTPIIIK